MLKEIDYRELQINPMTMIGQEWMLVTAGNEDNGYNTMTAAWGHLGSIWDVPGIQGHLPTAVIFVRPQRYTKEFVDREERFTLSVFEEDQKKNLAYLGTVSGRDENKIANAGLTPIFGEGTTWFAEAKLVFICKKLYNMTLQEAGFIDPVVLERNYPARDFHEMYIGQIEKVLIKE